MHAQPYLSFEGGAVQQPLIETFFAKGFGLVSARFGVRWTIVVAA